MLGSQAVSLDSTPFVRLRVLPKSMSLFWQGHNWRPNTLHLCNFTRFGRMPWKWQLRMVFACNSLVFNDLHCGKGAERWTTHLLQIWLRPLLPKPMMGRPWPWLLRRLPRFFCGMPWYKSEITITKILDEKHCGETVLMSHLQDDTAHHYVSFLTRSQLEAHDPAHIWLDHGCGPFVGHGKVPVLWTVVCLFSAEEQEFLQHVFFSGASCPKATHRGFPGPGWSRVLDLNRKNVLETTLLSGWCSPPVHLFANSLKTRGYLLNAQPRKFLLW